MAAGDNRGESQLNGYSEGRFIHMGSHHWVPQGSQPSGSYLFAPDFLCPGNIKLPSVIGLNTAWDVCTFQTFTWLHYWICFLAVDLRSDYTLETARPAFGIEMETITKEADDADEPSVYDTRLWSREAMGLHASKPVSYHCQGFVQNHKIQVTECSICLSWLDPVHKEWKKIIFIYSPSMLLWWPFLYTLMNCQEQVIPYLDELSH